MGSFSTSLDSGKWVWSFPVVNKQCTKKFSDPHNLDADDLHTLISFSSSTYTFFGKIFMEILSVILREVTNRQKNAVLAG